MAKQENRHRYGFVWLNILVFFVVSTLSPVMAQEHDPKGLPHRGSIENALGGPCWYTQTYEWTNPHFMPENLKDIPDNDLRTIRFDDPECMADSLGTLFAVRFNKQNIAKQIVEWFTGTYVAEEVRFHTDRFYAPIKGVQARGVCIADTRKINGIAVEFVSDGDSITKVIYAPSIGCGPRLD